MTWATVTGLGLGATSALALVVFIWRLVSWSRDDNKKAGRWEIDCRTAWAQRDASLEAHKITKESLARSEVAYAQLHASFTALARQTVSAVDDATAIKLAGGDLPPPRPSDELMPFPEG